MEPWDNDDYERPIETYEGYLGHWFDGSLFAEPELAPLAKFDFDKYTELVEECCDGERQLSIALPSGPITISYSAYDGIVEILDQLRTVKVCIDNGPPDAGPASGATVVFFIADGISKSELENSITAVAKALESDFSALARANNGHTSG